MISTYPKGLKESLSKRKEELKQSISEKDKILDEKRKLVSEMREFGAKYGLKGKEMAEAFKKYKATKKTPKSYKEGEIMDAKSRVYKHSNDKYAVETNMNIKPKLEPKIKRALKKSVVEALDEGIKGNGVRKIKLDYSSSEDEKPKRRGRPKKGKGYDSDSSSDEEDIKEYGKVLKHLIGHIKDPKEKIDPKDYKQAIELIKKIKSKKA